MSTTRLYALLILSWAFARMLLKKVFRFGPRGLALFRANYEGDHLSSISPAERAELAGYGRCIACGRCNVGDAPRIAESRGAYPGTMALMLASSRSLPDFAAASQALRFISDDDLAEKEGVCPTGVPMRKVARFIKNHA
jgi:succinate dehydrogenase/fumarate reductase-like Fe-S protein